MEVEDDDPFYEAFDDLVIFSIKELYNGLDHNIQNWTFMLLEESLTGRGAIILNTFCRALQESVTRHDNNRIVFLFQDNFLMHNLMLCFAKLHARPEIDSGTNEFLIATFRLIHEWSNRSAQVTHDLIQGRVLEKSILPFCWKFKLNRSVACAMVDMLVGVLFYDYEQNNCFKRTGMKMDEPIIKALMATVYKKHTNIDKFYESATKGVVLSCARRGSTLAKILERFVGDCFVDLFRRANDLKKSNAAWEEVEKTRRLSKKYMCPSEKPTCYTCSLKEKLHAIIECSHKLSTPCGHEHYPDPY